MSLHLLIHHPVAELLEQTTGNLISKIWHYNQPQLLKHPLRFFRFLQALRRERFDVAITSHNPDNFSLSQALAGRFFRPRYLIGFDWRDSARYYDIAVTSSIEKHYADAMVDLWRAIDPQAQCRFGGLEIPAGVKEWVSQSFFGEKTAESQSRVLFWLGATGNKILPPEAVSFVYALLTEKHNIPVQLAAGPADGEVIARYPQHIREQTHLWNASLIETAAFFSLFRLFVSGDTGPMHLAVAVGCPTITIFVNSNIRQYGYRDGERHWAVLWENSEEGKARVRKAVLEGVKKEKGKG